MMMLSREWIGLAVMVGALGCVEGPPATATSERALDGPAITTNTTIYAPGESIVVAWTNLPGNVHDWVGFAPTGSPPTTVTQWVYTAGAISGTHTFFAPSAVGSYSARAFVDDSYTLLAESAAFTVGTSGVTTDLASYTLGQSIQVSWTGLPGNAKDWVAIAPQGAPPQTVTRWVYTGGATDGTFGFEGLGAAGSYVARTFLDDSYTLFDESAVFVVAAGGNTAISTDQTSYPVQAPVVVTWSGFPGGATDWIGIAPQGASAQTTLSWTYMGGRAAGTATLNSPTTPGSFVVRVFANDSYVIIGETAPFTTGP